MSTVSPSTTARHRSSRPSSTPLSQARRAMRRRAGTRIGTLGRSGAVVAMSSGMVATLGLSAQAQTAQPVSAASAQMAQPLTITSASARMAAKADAHLRSELATRLRGSTVAAHREALAKQRKTAKQRVIAQVAARSARTASSPRATRAVPAPQVGVLALAARYVGVAYRYGGTSPRGFDCAGYTQYVYRQLGVNLPRTAQQQLDTVRRVPRSQARPGDLVFVVSSTSGSASTGHVGIYAGGNMMYDSPRTGKNVSLRAIYTSQVVFGRV